MAAICRNGRKCRDPLFPLIPACRKCQQVIGNAGIAENSQILDMNEPSNRWMQIADRKSGSFAIKAQHWIILDYYCHAIRPCYWSWKQIPYFDVNMQCSLHAWKLMLADNIHKKSWLYKSNILSGQPLGQASKWCAYISADMWFPKQSEKWTFWMFDMGHFVWMSNCKKALGQAIY